jgi:hypothetical protein
LAKHPSGASDRRFAPFVLKMIAAGALRWRKPAGIWRRTGAWMERRIPIGRLNEDVRRFHGVARGLIGQIGMRRCTAAIRAKP